jgi:hypothetical protein
MNGLGGSFGEGLMDKATAYTKGNGYLADGLSLGTKSLELLGVDRYGFPANTKSFCAPVRNASLNSLADQVTLKLSKRSHHIKHESSGWRGQIEAVAEAYEGDAKGFKFTQSRDQVFE